MFSAKNSHSCRQEIHCLKVEKGHFQVHFGPRRVALAWHWLFAFRSHDSFLISANSLILEKSTGRVSSSSLYIESNMTEREREAYSARLHLSVFLSYPST